MSDYDVVYTYKIAGKMYQKATMLEDRWMDGTVIVHACG